MEKEKNPGHQPERFEVYNELPSRKGFTIKGTDHVFIFNKYGGWYDEYHNYYNQDGEPEQPPSDDEDEDYQLSNHDDDPYEDEFQKEYGPSIDYHQQQEDLSEHPTVSQLKHIQNIQTNLTTLGKYPVKTPMRIDFSNFNYKVRKDEILKYFRTKVSDGILNVVTYKNQQGKFNGEGYFVVKDVGIAQKLVKLQGQQFQGRQFYLDIEPIENLLMEPVSKQQMGDSVVINQDDFQSLGQVIIIDPKSKAEKAGSNQQKKKYLPKTKEQRQIQAKEIKEAEEKKKNIQKSQNFTWSKYHVDVTMFPKKSSFKDWMKSMNYQQEKHFKSIQKVQPKDASRRQATLQLRSDVFDSINNKVYEGQVVTFTKM